MAVADGAEGYAEAYTDNLGKDEGAAGNDEILTGWCNDIVAGDSQARASDTAIGDADNKGILGDGSAGNDYSAVDGRYRNTGTGDAQGMTGGVDRTRVVRGKRVTASVTTVGQVVIIIKK